MMRTRKPSQATCLVLSQLRAQPQYGYALMKATGLKSGSLYPILMRLTDRGMLSARWETPDVTGRPARQLYQLTAQGHQYSSQALEPQAPATVKPAAINGAIS